MKPRDRALILDAIAVYRLTRLITKDSLLVDWRDNTVRLAYARQDADNHDALQAQMTLPGDWSHYAGRDPSAPKLAALATCRWCSSMWVAAGVLAARSACPKTWDPIARLLVMAAAGALIAGLEQ